MARHDVGSQEFDQATQTGAARCDLAAQRVCPGKQTGVGAPVPFQAGKAVPSQDRLLVGEVPGDMFEQPFVGRDDGGGFVLAGEESVDQRVCQIEQPAVLAVDGRFATFVRLLPDEMQG